MRSSKYPSGPCYGIIINARCDIAQHKISKYYYLTAVDAQAWFSSKYGYTLVYGKMIEDKRRDICNKAKELELDGHLSYPFLRKTAQLFSKMQSSSLREIKNQ